MSDVPNFDADDGFIAYPIEEFTLSNGDKIQVTRTEFNTYTAYYTHLLVQSNDEHPYATGNWAFTVRKIPKELR